MGNLFCDCTRKVEPVSRPEDNLPDFKESNMIKDKILTGTGTKKEIDGFSKKITINEIWNDLEQSSLIGKGKGNPRDKYQFLEQIGEGSFGVVYKAKIKKTGELRAIKIIKKQKDSIAYEKNIIKEIELLESIDHPNIIKIYEFYDCPEYICIVSELGKGGSFVYVPKGVKLDIPLQSYFRLNSPESGQFEHTLIIVDEGASLHFIEGCSAPKYNKVNLHAGCVELYVKDNAYLRYSTIENWSKNMMNLNTKKAIVGKNSTIGLAGTKNSYILFKNGQKIREIKEKDVFNEFKKELDLYKN